MEELLDSIGWDKKTFARRVGVSPRTVGRWCNGTPNPVAMAYLELVARILG